MTTPEAEAIEAAYVKIIQDMFAILVEGTEDGSKWSEGAIARFMAGIRHARKCRDDAIKAIEALDD
jgi:hypothetical protein